jgi:hypothetical protein
MNKSHLVSKKDLEAFDSKIKTSRGSNILSVSDLNDNLIHYGIVGPVDTSITKPAHSITVKTANGDKLSRIFDDKRKSAGLEEGDAFTASFKVSANGYANLDKIAKD